MITTFDALIACVLCAAMGGIVCYALRDLLWGGVSAAAPEEIEFEGCPNCANLEVQYDVALDMATRMARHVERVTAVNGQLAKALEEVTAERDALAGQIRGAA